ncbi:hypothetical protein [Sphingomonas sp. GV3]|uniref:hypothetical protein n=1 Tax=Sphingomonas sp. GV3 TaxID=3040671 RepID=UPI00280ABE6D|nr:hypothetical protein [Sphingomonas sp. GV3]
MVEQGTVADASDGGWNGFSSLQQVARGFDGLDRQTSETTSAGGTVYLVVQKSYVGQRLECSAVRLNNAVWGTLPASACTAQAEGPSGPDRITRYGYDAAGRVAQVTARFADSSVKAKAERADELRRAFQLMDALVSESFRDGAKTVIRVAVKCDVSTVPIMERGAPLGAYAGVACTAAPPL